MARARTLTLKTKVEVTGADKLNNLGKRLQSTGRTMTVGLTVPIVAAGAAFVDMAIEAEKAQSKLDNTFRSMNAGAFTTIDALNETAEAVERSTTFAAEDVKQLQAVLLTFGNVTGESFDRATAAALDMSALLGQDLQSSAIQLGKALNDPIKGITALTRVGVSFTDAQKETIRTLATMGDVAGAQAVILAEVERQFGGTAEAIGRTTRGKLVIAMNALGAAGESLAVTLLPTITNVAKGLTDLAAAFVALPQPVKDTIGTFALVLAAVGPVLLVVGKLVSAYSALVRIAPAVGASWPLLAPPAFVGLALGMLKDQIHDVVNPDGPTYNEMFAASIGNPEALLKPLTDAQWDAVEESGNAWAEQRNIISDAIYGPGGMVPLIIQGADDMAEEMGEAPGKMADELLAAQFRLTDATSQLVAFMEQAITPAQEMMELQGFLASNELANGLASNNPLIAQKSAEMRDAALSRLAELQGQAFDYGNNVGTSFAAGMNAAYGWVVDAAGNLAAAARNQIGINSEPKDPRSPLYGITKWGANIARTLAAGMSSGVAIVEGAATRLAGAAVIGSTVGVSAASPAAGSGGGMTINHIYLQWDGEPPKGRNESEIVANLQRLSPLIGGKLATGYG